MRNSQLSTRFVSKSQWAMEDLEILCQIRPENFASKCLYTDTKRKESLPDLTISRGDLEWLLPFTSSEIDKW